MDKVYCFCPRLLLWSTLIILLFQKTSGSPRVCPQGQLLHLRPNYVTCCYPTRCAVGEEVRPCAINGTQDICQVCGAYQNQSLRTSSFTMERRCTDWPLNKECKSIDKPDKQRDILDEQTKRCMCNIEQGKKFDPPESGFPGAHMDSYCQRRNDTCKPGFEPEVDGGCRPCRQNNFKSVEGYGLCEPKTNCSLLGLDYKFLSDSSTVDNNCIEPDPIVTTKPSTPRKSYAVTATPETIFVVSSQSSLTTSGISWSEVTVHLDTSLGSADRHRTNNKYIWPIVGSVLFLVVLAASIALVMCCRRRGMSVCSCAYFDPEKNGTQRSTSEQMDQRAKHVLGNGSVHSQHVNGGIKVVSNGVAEMLSDIEDHPNGHANRNIQHGQYYRMLHESDGIEEYTDPHCANISPRPGILRNPKKSVTFGQSRGSMKDRGQGELHINGFEANPNCEETDHLLISKQTQGEAFNGLRNLSVLAGKMPAGMPAGVNSVHILALNGCGKANFGHIFVKNGPCSPTGQPLGPELEHIPAADPTFTRSVSVIASPEGEADEDDRFPRFSQLLPEGQDTSAIDSSHDAHVDPANQQNCHQGNLFPQQRTGLPPALELVPQTNPHGNHSDHHIMNLKEKDLVESMHSSFSSNHSDTSLKTATNLAATTVAEEAQQTERKTLVHSATDEFINTTAGAHVNANKAVDFFEGTEHQQSDREGISHNSAERKKHKIGGGSGKIALKKKHIQSEMNSPYFSDRKRASSGSPSNSGKNTLDHHCTPMGDHQRPYVKASSSEESSTTSEKHHKYNNHVVPFEENESPQNGHKQGPKTDPWQAARSQNTSEKKVSTGYRYRAPLRSVSDPEQADAGLAGGSTDETKWNHVSQKLNVSSGSSKTSVNSVLSGTEDNCCNPNKSAMYGRSQSQNAPSSSESCHKPPPRSMSEEKPQKLDRPVAKVKPMPASDTSVNQLPLEVTGDNLSLIPQHVFHTVTANSSIAATVSSNSNESDHEHDIEGNHHCTLTLEEEEGERTDNDLEETGV